MHPQIRQGHPGNCPICGMALEPEIAAEATGPSAELIDMTRRFWIALALSIPVFALEMGGHLAGPHWFLSEALSNWIQLALATPVALWAGWPFFERGWASLKTRNLNMFTLIAMGVGVAWAYSVVATVAPGLFPSAFRGAHGAVGDLAYSTKVFRRLGDEFSAAAGGAEEESLPAVLGLVFGRRRINRHAANGVRGERACGLGRGHRRMVLVFHEGRA